MQSKLLQQVKVHEPEEIGDAKCYRLADIQAIPGIEIIEPVKECYLALLRDGICIDFAVLTWCGEGDGIIYVEPLLVGNGTGGNLREIRHTWWGPWTQGYLFYMPLQKTLAALEALKTYFSD